MTPIRGVIFDKDGTLFDFEQTWNGWTKALLHKIARDEAQAAMLGEAVGYNLAHGTFAPDSVVIAGTPQQIAEALSAHLRPATVVDMLDLINAEAATVPQVEVVPLLSFATGLRKAGYQLGVVTNDAEGPARAHLNVAGVTSQFTFIAGSDSGWGAKPDPGQLLACAEAMCVPAAHVVMVGDSTHDLVAASRAGMRAVAVLSGVADADVLGPYAEVVLPHIGHLPAWLDAQMHS